MSSIHYQKNVPITRQADVCILGGGFAGVCAAMTAADLGMRTVLIERWGMLGGNATAGGVANFCGNTVGQGRSFDEIIEALEAFQAIQPVNPQKDGRLFNHEVLASILPQLLRKKGVDVFLNTVLTDVTTEGRRIRAALVTGPSGLCAVTGRYFIDCTGDGFAALRAGYAHMKGNRDGHQLPMSVMGFVKHCAPEDQATEVAPGWFAAYSEKDQLPMTTLWPDGPGSNAVKIKVPLFDSTDTESFTAAQIAAREKMMSVLDYYQRVEGKNFLLSHCSPQIGIREGVRITGDYVLTLMDLAAGRAFQDGVAVGTFYLDGHKPDDDKRTYILDPSALGVPPYDIPLRCLVARDGDNLLMAGRCLSAEQLALSSARVIPTCAMTGQAAAAAAALAVLGGMDDIRGVSADDVRAALISRGAQLDKSKVSVPGAKPLFTFKGDEA